MKQIPCLKHDGSYLLFIKTDINKTEYVCEECCMKSEGQQLKVELSNLIHIKNAIRSPEFLFSKLNSSSLLSEFFTELDKYNDNTMKDILIDFQIKVSKLQSGLQAIYKELEEQAKNFLEMKQKIREELTKIIKFDQFKQFLVNLEQLGDSINPEAIQQNEKILHLYLKDLTKNDCQDVNKTVVDMLDRINGQPKDLSQEQYPQYLKFQEQVKSFNATQIKFAQQINLLNLCQMGSINNGKLISFYQLQKIMSIIYSKLYQKVISFSQIFLGSRDGLKGQDFWSKVHGKTNLLMIFKSKSGYIFGGFSPCQWQQNLKGYVQDNTISSFLFSQTHDQIYLLKGAYKAYATYCSLSYGPIFGDGHDIYIGADFQSGYSKLGISYECEQYQIGNKKTHLFGQQTPNIEECEIYQVILS